MKGGLRRRRLLGRVRLALPLFAMLPACQAMPAPATATVLASQPARCDNIRDTAGSGARGQAFFSASGWRAHLEGSDAALRAALASWEVDPVRGQSVALVRVGPQPNPGYRVLVEQKTLPVSARTLRVDAVVQPPPGQMIQAQVIAFPCVYLKLEGPPYDQVEVTLQPRLPR